MHLPGEGLSPQSVKSIAQRGKTTKGWFHGFKLHLAINGFGEMLAFQISPGNVDDRVPGVSKGYISAKPARQLLGQGVGLVACCFQPKNLQLPRWQNTKSHSLKQNSGYQ